MNRTTHASAVAPLAIENGYDLAACGGVIGPKSNLTVRSRDALWRATIILIFGLFLIKLFFMPGFLGDQNAGSQGIQSADVGAFSKNKAIGVGYYTELAKSFLYGKTYLDVSMNEALLKHSNPHSLDAYLEGVIIQDASFFKGKYYLYYGPGPVVALYLPFRWLTGTFPSDKLVISALGVAYGVLLLLLLQAAANARTWSILPMMCLLLANPVMLKSIVSLPTVHGVSRLFASTCVLASAYLLLKFWRGLQQCSLQVSSGEARNYGRYALVFFSSVFICLAIATRPTALPDLAAITLLFTALLWTERTRLNRECAGLVISYAAPILLTLAALGWYNNVRFESPFQFGQKYVTHGQDLINGLPMIRPPSDLMFHIANLAHKLYEYFLVLPVVNPGTTFAFRMGTASPYVSGAYSEGAVGLLAWAPALLLIPIALWREFSGRIRQAVKTWRFPHFFLLTALTCFWFNFWLLSNVPITAFHFSLEFVPRLALVVAALFLCNSPEFRMDTRAPLRSIALVLTVLFSLNGLWFDHLI